MAVGIYFDQFLTSLITLITRGEKVMCLFWRGKWHNFIVQWKYLVYLENLIFNPQFLLSKKINSIEVHCLWNDVFDGEFARFSQSYIPFYIRSRAVSTYEVWVRFGTQVQVQDSVIFEKGGCGCGGTQQLKNY